MLGDYLVSNSNKKSFVVSEKLNSFHGEVKGEVESNCQGLDYVYNEPVAPSHALVLDDPTDELYRAITSTTYSVLDTVVNFTVGNVGSTGSIIKVFASAKNDIDCSGVDIPELVPFAVNKGDNHSFVFNILDEKSTVIYMLPLLNLMLKVECYRNALIQ